MFLCLLFFCVVFCRENGWEDRLHVEWDVKMLLSQLLDVPHYRLSSFARLAFSVSGTSAWNSLPDYLRDPAVGSNSFRKQLKTFLFATY